jgi:hypothetical protein
MKMGRVALGFSLFLALGRNKEQSAEAGAFSRGSFGGPTPTAN